MHQLQRLLEILWHCISHSMALFSPCACTSNTNCFSHSGNLVSGRFCCSKSLESSGRQVELCSLCSIPLPTSSCCKAEGSSYLISFSSVFQLCLIPCQSPAAYKDTGLAPTELPHWLQNVRGAFSHRGLDLYTLPHAAGSLGLKSAGGGRRCQSEDRCVTTQTTPVFFCLSN